MRSEDREIGSRLDQLSESLVEVQCIVRDYGQKPSIGSLEDAVNPRKAMGMNSCSSSDYDSSDAEVVGLRQDEEDTAAERDQSPPTSGKKRKEIQPTTWSKLFLRSPTQRRPPGRRLSAASLPVSWSAGGKVDPEDDSVYKSNSLGIAARDSSPRSGLTLRQKLFGRGTKKVMLTGHESSVPEVITNKYAEQLEAT